MVNHYGALEADFAHYYNGLQLGGIWTGEISLRRAGTLAAELPAGAAVYRAEEVDDAWTQLDHLQAATFDALNVANWQRAGGKGPAPEPLPRPSDAQRLRQKAARIGGQAQLARARQKARRERLAKRQAATPQPKAPTQ